MLARRPSLVIGFVVAAAVALSCGRLAVKRKDESKKSEPTEAATDGTGATDGAPGEVTTDPCIAEPLDGALCGAALTQSIADAREDIGAVVAAFGPKSLTVPETHTTSVLAFLDELTAQGTFKSPTARKGLYAGISWSITSSSAWHVATEALSIVRADALVRVSTATSRFTLQSIDNEGWTAESLVTGTDCSASLARIVKSLAVYQGKIMLREGCDAFVYTDFVGDDATTTASSVRLGPEDDPKSAATPALEANPYCARPGQTPVFGKACTSTVAAILVGAYGDSALWVSPKELRDLKTTVEPVP